MESNLVNDDGINGTLGGRKGEAEDADERDEAARHCLAIGVCQGDDGECKHTKHVDGTTTNDDRSTSDVFDEDDGKEWSDDLVVVDYGSNGKHVVKADKVEK